MLYGHIENDEDRVDHMVRLRKLQDETGGLVTFIPLAFHPANTALEHLPTTTGFEDLKNIAVARLMLDNVPHIKAYWVMMTPRIAQIAQRFGSDDIDGTVVEEKIYHDAGATTSQSLRRTELLGLIRASGREPVERDTLYRPVQRTETTLHRTGLANLHQAGRVLSGALSKRGPAELSQSFGRRRDRLNLFAGSVCNLLHQLVILLGAGADGGQRFHHRLRQVAAVIHRRFRALDDLA